MPSVLFHDVLVVGSGVAGLRAALAARDNGADVAIASKFHPLRSDSVGIHSGINAALEGDDSWEKHAFDTVNAGDYLSNQSIVQELCEKAPETIRELEELGVLFSRTEERQIARRSLGSHAFPRTCFFKEKIGRSVMNSLYFQALKKSIPIHENMFPIKLAVEENSCVGVVFFNFSSGELEAVQARSVILATEGSGRIYARTTNGFEATGDGVGLAFSAGVPLLDMEFIQFHPTALPGSSITIGEIARAEGGHLVNKRGERFMKEYAPQLLELAPRDVVARAVESEIDAGRGFEGGTVYLDLRHLKRETILERLPGARETALKFSGIDIVQQPLPVQSAQHCCMGGIAVNAEGASELEGLYACGEAACNGVHGANRLGGNALLESLVFGKKTGAAAARHATLEHANETPTQKTIENSLKTEKEKLEKLFSRKGISPFQLRASLQETMSEFAGAFRDEKRLKIAKKKIAELKQSAARIAVQNKQRALNSELLEALQIIPSLDVAEAIVSSALARKESRGAHYRHDHLERDDVRWLKHSKTMRRKNEPPLVEFIEVQTSLFKPKRRKY